MFWEGPATWYSSKSQNPPGTAERAESLEPPPGLGWEAPSDLLPCGAHTGLCSQALGSDLWEPEPTTSWSGANTCRTLEEKGSLHSFPLCLGHVYWVWNDLGHPGEAVVWSLGSLQRGWFSGWWLASLQQDVVRHTEAWGKGQPRVSSLIHYFCVLALEVKIHT